MNDVHLAKYFFCYAGSKGLQIFATALNTCMIIFCI